MKTTISKSKANRTIIKKCHNCGQVVESATEVQKCLSCNKSFLPLNYFDKVHDKEAKYEELFAHSHEIEEEDLIKGLYVLW